MSREVIDMRSFPGVLLSSIWLLIALIYGAFVSRWDIPQKVETVAVEVGYDDYYYDGYDSYEITTYDYAK